MQVYFLVGAVFLAVLTAALVLGRRQDASQAGGRVDEYIKLSSDSEALQISTRREEEASGLGRLLSFAAVTAPAKLRASVATDLARAHVRMRPAMFLGIRGVLLVTAVSVA